MLIYSEIFTKRKNEPGHLVIRNSGELPICSAAHGLWYCWTSRPWRGTTKKPGNNGRFTGENQGDITNTNYMVIFWDSFKMKGLLKMMDFLHWWIHHVWNLYIVIVYFSPQTISKSGDEGRCINLLQFSWGRIIHTEQGTFLGGTLGNQLCGLLEKNPL